MPMPEDEAASTGDAQELQEPGSTGTKDGTTGPQDAPDPNAPVIELQDGTSKGAGDATGGAGEGGEDAADKKDAEVDADDGDEAAAAKAEAEAQSKRDAETNVKKLQRERDAAVARVEAFEAQQRVQRQEALQRMQRADAEKVERLLDSEVPEERDEGVRLLRDSQRQEKTVKDVWAQADAVIRERQFYEVLERPLFSELTEDERQEALAELSEQYQKDRRAPRDGQGQVYIPYDAAVEAFAGRLVAKKVAGHEEVIAEKAALEEKIETLTQQLTDAGIVAAGAPPRSLNGAAAAGLTAEKYREQLRSADGDLPSADEIDRLTSTLL